MYSARPSPKSSVALHLERYGRPRVVGARRGLRHAFANVVRNAIENSPVGHPVRIRVAGDGPLAIVDVHDDGGGVPAPLRDRVFEVFYSTRAGSDGLGEREIFDLIVRGSTNAEIAKQLFISIKTVETHRTRILRKLGVHSLGELIRLAVRRGLLPA